MSEQEKKNLDINSNKKPEMLNNENSNCEIEKNSILTLKTW